MRVSLVRSCRLGERAGDPAQHLDIDEVTHFTARSPEATQGGVAGE
jgi:hypothetical protein